MNPQKLFCPMITCPARGQTGKGNIHIHSLKDKRCLCDICGQTFTTTKGTIFYRLRTNPEIVIWVIVLLAYGCPIQAIVKATCARMLGLSLSKPCRSRRPGHTAVWAGLAPGGRVGRRSRGRPRPGRGWPLCRLAFRG